MKINMELKELNDYLGITDNINYIARAKLIEDYRILEKMVANMDYEKLEIIRKDDYYINKLNNKIIYEYNDLIVYKK